MSASKLNMSLADSGVDGVADPVSLLAQIERLQAQNEQIRVERDQALAATEQALAATEQALAERELFRVATEQALAERDQGRAATEQALAERELFRVATEQALAERDQGRARFQLFDDFGKACTDSAVLLELIDKCDLGPIPESYLVDYLRTSDQNTSGTYVRQDKSSVTSLNSAGNLHLNKMRRHMTQNTDSKVLLKELALNEVCLEDILCTDLFEGDRDSFNFFVSSQVDILNKLRQALYHLGHRGSGGGRTSVREVNDLQPLAALFLHGLAKRFHPEVCVGFAQAASERLSGQLFVGESRESQIKRDVSGFADLIVRSNEHDGRFLFLAELKTPGSDLCHSGAFAAKDQLVFELELFATMECNLHPPFVLGGLLDMIAIAVAARKVEQSDGSVTFYISPRVTESRAFVLRALLLLCGDKASVWDKILPLSTQNLDLPGEGSLQPDEAADGVDSEDGADDAHVGELENVFPGAAGGGAAYTSSLASALKAMRASERREEYKRGLRETLAWDSSVKSARQGLAPLTTAALNAFNSQQSTETRL